MELKKTHLISLLTLVLLILTGCATTQLEPVTSFEELTERAQSMESFHYEYELQHHYEELRDSNIEMSFMREGGVTQERTIVYSESLGKDEGRERTVVYTADWNIYCDGGIGISNTCWANSNYDTEIGLHEFLRYYDHELTDQFKNIGQKTTQGRTCQEFQNIFDERTLRDFKYNEDIEELEVIEIGEHYRNITICIDELTGQVIKAKHERVANPDNDSKEITTLETLQLRNYEEQPNDISYPFSFAITNAVYNENTGKLSVEYYGLETMEKEVYYKQGSSESRTVKLDVVKGSANEIEISLNRLSFSPRLCKDSEGHYCHLFDPES